MSDENIYETLKISIYCSWEELMQKYQAYTQERTRDKIKAEDEAQELVDENPWLIEAKAEFDEKGAFDAKDRRQSEIFERYCNSLENSARQSRLYSKITKAFIESQIASPAGKEAKENYDKTHKTPYAILGTSPYVRRGDLPSSEKAKELAGEYPDMAREIKQAFDEVTLIEKRKQDKYNMAQTKKIEPKEETDTKKKGFSLKSFMKRIWAPALIMLGISTGVPKLLEAPKEEDAQPSPAPASTTLPEETSFREQIKVNGATVKLTDKETTITPSEGFAISQIRTTSFENILNAHSGEQQYQNVTTNNNVSVTQTSTAKPEATQGPLTGLKTKIQNDDELRKIAEHALNNVKVGEKYDVSVYDKLDYIMELIENQNYDHILGTVPGMGGIKNCILDLVDDVTLYYIRKDVGQPGCYIRFSEEYENKPVITADFNVVNESNTRYIATAEKGVANNNKPYGTTQKVDGTVAGTIKKSKLFREKNIDLSSYTLNAEMQIVKDLLLSLNEIGNKEIIISRNSQNER